MACEPNERKMIFDHLKAFEKKKPDWISARKLSEVISQPYLGEHRLKIYPRKHAPSKEHPYFMAYFEGKKKKGPNRRILVKAKGEHKGNPGIFLRYLENPNKMNVDHILEKLKQRVRLYPYKDVQFHLMGYHPETGERIQTSFYLGTKEKY